MKTLMITLAMSSLAWGWMPDVLADTTEFRAVLTSNKQVQIVNTVPTGLTVLNNGAVVTGGETLALPAGGTIILPKTLRTGMIVTTTTVAK